MVSIVENDTGFQLRMSGAKPVELPKPDLSNFDEEAQALALRNEVARVVAERTVEAG